MKKSLLSVALLLIGLNAGHAQIVISEVDAAGSAASYAADWYELTNTGTSAVDITGWKMDDNSASFSLAVPLRNVTSIAAGQSVVFLEGTASGSTDAAIDAAFKSAWFGSNVPSNLVLGGYGGSGVGLSQTTDAVNIFNSTGALIASVNFNASPSNGATFDNTASLSNTTISTASSIGVHGAFTSAKGNEIGSPGVDTAVVAPEPNIYALMLIGVAALVISVRRRKQGSVQV